MAGKECACNSWVDATVSTAAFGAFVSCNDEEMLGMELPSGKSLPHVTEQQHSDHSNPLSANFFSGDVSSSSSSSSSCHGRPFLMRPLRCVVSSRLGRVDPCDACGIGEGKKLSQGDCPCFSVDALRERVIWLKRQETVEGKGLDQVRVRLRSYQGTLGELLTWVEENYKETLHHKWRAKYLRHQFHLESEYFEPTSAVVLADFASAMVVLVALFCLT